MLWVGAVALVVFGFLCAKFNFVDQGFELCLGLWNMSHKLEILSMFTFLLTSYYWCFFVPLERIAARIAEEESNRHNNQAVQKNFSRKSEILEYLKRRSAKKE